MQVKGISRKSTDSFTKFIFDLGPDGRLEVSFPSSNKAKEHNPEGACFGSWYGLDGSFHLMNNFDYIDDDIYDGVEQPFMPAQAGAAFDYFWEKRQQVLRARREQEYQEYLRRKARRERKLSEQASLRGGLGRACGPSKPLIARD